MIQLTDFTKVVDTYKKNFDIRSKRFSDKKKKDIIEKKEEREKKIESNKIFSLKRIQSKAIGKSQDILDTVIRFAGFTLLGVIVKNLDKIIITVKTIIEKLKEFAIKAKKFFDERVAPFLKDVFNLGKDIFNVFVGIGDFLIDMNPFKDFDSEFNILLRGILGLAARLGELNVPKGKLPGSTNLPSKEPAKIPAKTPVKTPVETPAKTPRTPKVVTKTYSPTQTPVGAGTGTGTGTSAGAGTGARVGKKFFGDLAERTAPASGLSLDAQRRMLKGLTDQLLEETSGEFKGLQDPKIRGPYSPIEPRVNYSAQPFKTNMYAPTVPKLKKLSLYEKFLRKGRQVLGSIEKGKVALGDFAKSLQSKLGGSADALKKLGDTKIPGIGLLNIIPMSARRFVGRSLRVLGLYFLAREVEQDLRNGDVNAAVVKLSAYGLGWLVTSAGLLTGSALGISGFGTVAGVAVLAGSIGAGAGTEALIRKSFLKEKKEKESDSTPKVQPKVPVVDDSLERLEFPEHFNKTSIPDPKKRADEDNYDSGGNKIRIGDTVGYDISRGLNSSTTYDNQGRFTSREVVIAIQPVEKEVPVPVEIG